MSSAAGDRRINATFPGATVAGVHAYARARVIPVPDALVELVDTALANLDTSSIRPERPDRSLRSQLVEARWVELRGDLLRAIQRHAANSGKVPEDGWMTYTRIRERAYRNLVLHPLELQRMLIELVGLGALESRMNRRGTYSYRLKEGGVP